MELSSADESLKIEENFVNFYCEINVNSICRVCLEKSESDRRMYNIFEAKVQVHLTNMIMSCASVQIVEGDGLPNLICQKCMAKLNVAWQFKTQCEMSDAKLRHFYNSQMPLAPTIDEFSKSMKEQMDIKNEEQHSMNYTHTIMHESFEINISDKIQKIHEDEEEPESTAIKKPARAKEKPKEPKIHQCDTCGKTFNRKEYLTQHIRIHTGEKPYHCHLCEKRFINSGHLTTHMRKHTGERPHACTLCPKAFSTRQELQKHTMVHNGDRPFLCKMCGKRFGSSSNLYSHLKHHTGEKNFTCEHCGKAFYTKQELKQHLVVHTGEKAFLCEFCNKRFSQIAHLRRHSKLHKASLQ